MENELPQGWVWTTLGEVCTKPQYGWTTKASHKSGSVRLLRTTDISSRLVDWNTVPYCSDIPDNLADYELRDGDIVISRAGSVGLSYLLSYIPVEAVFASYLIRFRPFEAVDPRYIAYYLQTPEYWKFINEQSSGIALANVNARKLETANIPLAPFTEQHRIVAAIEQQFSRLDAAVTSLQHARAKLKRQRAAILKAAVEGTLTAGWRAQHPETDAASSARIRIFSLESNAVSQINEKRRLWGSGHVTDALDEIREELPAKWELCKVKDLSPNLNSVVQIGPMSMRSSEFSSEGVPVLNVGCVKWGYFDLAKLDFLPLELATKFDRYRLKAGDVVFTRSGTVGRCAIVSADQDNWLMTFHLLRVRLDPRVCLPKYLMFVFEGFPHVRVQITDASVGSTRAGFNTRLLEELDIPLPPLAEQIQIVSEVEARLSIIAQTEMDVEASLKRAERLRQTILAEAFAGRLVAQEPDDEPAGVLLERIRREREGMQKKGKNGNGRKAISVTDEPVEIDVEAVEQVALWEGVGG